MSGRNRRISAAFAAFTVPFVLACDSDITGPGASKEAGPPTEFTTMSLEPSNVTMWVGERLQMDALGTGRDGITMDLDAIEPVFWSSSNPDVVTVTASGMIVAHAEGSAVIEAGCGPLTATAVVDVLPAGIVDPGRYVKRRPA